MAAHLKAQGAFGDPDRPAGGHPPVDRRSRSRTASPTTRRARWSTYPRPSGAPPGPGWSPSCARSAGCRSRSSGGFAAGQPQYNFQIPLAPGRTEDDVLAGMNQQWRRNIKKAAKAGVEVAQARPTGHATTSRRSTGCTSRPPSATTSPPPAVLLPHHGRRAVRRGPGPDPALPRPPRGRPGGGHDLDPGRHPHLVLLRRLLDPQARGARVQRDPVADDPRLARRRRRRLRPARHHRHARLRRLRTSA